jgi:signal transduction histidine kinase
MRRIDQALSDAMHSIDAVVQAPAAVPRRVSLLHLTAAASELARERFDLPVTLRAGPGDFEVESTLAHDIGLLMAEALRNVSLHARASQATVDLRCDDTSLTVEISDDGVGFDPAAQRSGHFGLIGMRERAASIGASLDIVSAPDAGTRVSLMIPAGPSSHAVNSPD